VLGLVELEVEGRPVALDARQPRTLLALLALHANAPVAADRLIEGIWGEDPPASAQKMVQLYVSRLRRLLETSDAEILTRGRGYELRIDADAVDALRFERLVEAATRTGDGTIAREALALWRGPPLDDVSGELLAPGHVQRLEELHARARELAIDADLAAGGHLAALGVIEGLIAESPLREHPHAQRMLALYRAGRQADALDAYREARRRPPWPRADGMRSPSRSTRSRSSTRGRTPSPRRSAFPRGRARSPRRTGTCGCSTSTPPRSPISTRARAGSSRARASAT
jgi:DNA-binding SARP family transcriptional activator